MKEEDEKVSTIVSSTGAVAVVAGLFAANTLAPVAATALVVGGTLAAAGALAYKLSEGTKPAQDHDQKPKI